MKRFIRGMVVDAPALVATSFHTMVTRRLAVVAAAAANKTYTLTDEMVLSVDK
jgi:hypothetical protein